MAKLTDRQKSNIRAKWKTGEYTKLHLAKVYKVDEKTIRNITDGVEPENAHIVEAAVLVEKAKKSEKSPIETAAINKAVNDRLAKEHYEDKNTLRIYELTDKVLDKVENMLDSGKRLEKVGAGAGIQQLIPVDLGSSDYKNAIDTIDKAAVIKRVADRHAPKGDTNVNVQTNQIQTYGDAVADALKRKYNS